VQRRWVAGTPVATIKVRWRAWCAAVSGRGRGGDSTRLSAAHSHAASGVVRRREEGGEAPGCDGGRRLRGRARAGCRGRP
jgi:hypothetical protein